MKVKASKRLRDFSDEVLLNPAGRQGPGVRHGVASEQDVALEAWLSPAAGHSVSFAHSAAAGKALTQVQYTSPGVQHRARVFVLRGVRHGVITKPVLCLRRRSPQSKKYRRERSPFFFGSFGVRASTQYSACGDAPPKARNTGRSARHFFFEFWSESEYPYSA